MINIKRIIEINKLLIIALSLVILTKTFVIDFYTTSENISSEYGIHKIGFVEKLLFNRNDLRTNDVVSFDNDGNRFFGYKIGIIKSISENKVVLSAKGNDEKMKEITIPVENITGKIIK